MLKAIVRFINGTSGWPYLTGVQIVTNNTNETLKHMKYYWQKKHPSQRTAARLGLYDARSIPLGACAAIAKDEE